MDDERPTNAELLDAWRDTTRAAELAERLARMAADSAEQADENAIAYEEIADMAEAAKDAAERAASNARQAAHRARERATTARDVHLRDADHAASARADETAARTRYQEDGYNGSKEADRA